MQVGLMRVRRGSPHLTSPCDGAHYGYFAAQPVWRYAASLAASAAMAGPPSEEGNVVVQTPVIRSVGGSLRADGQANRCCDGLRLFWNGSSVISRP